LSELVSLLVAHEPEEVAEMLRQADPDGFDRLVKDSLREKLDEAARQVT
jgi:hypothetical protein